MFDRKQIKAKAKAQLGSNIFATNWLLALVVALIYGLILGAVSWTVVGVILLVGPLTFGISAMFLKQARDGQKMSVADLFAGFSSDFGGTVVLGLLEAVFVFLWSLLFVIPGIVKAYSYSMIFYIKADHPEYDWHQCFAESKRITKGHKGDLFVMDLSFLGWLIVGSLCFGIGTLWVEPYMMAARAQAYEAIRDAA